MLQRLAGHPDEPEAAPVVAEAAPQPVAQKPAPVAAPQSPEARGWFPFLGQPKRRKVDSQSINHC